MAHITRTEYVSITQAATKLGVSPLAVKDLLDSNEIESRVLILANSLDSYIAAKCVR